MYLIIQQIPQHLGLYVQNLSRDLPNREVLSNDGEIIYEPFDDGWLGYDEPSSVSLNVCLILCIWFSNHLKLKKEAHDFGIIIGIVLLIIGCVNYFKGHELYSYLFSGSALFFFLSLLLPRVLFPLQKTWMTLAVIMGWIVSRVIISILFHIIFTLIGLLGKLFGKHFLVLEIGRKGKSYWVSKNNDKERRIDL